MNTDPHDKHAHWPTLLRDTATSIGAAANIDLHSAAFLTLAVTGALAGPVRITVPGTGVYTPTVSAIITGGSNVRLALAILVEELEHLLVGILQQFQDLTDGRLIAQEIRRTETVLKGLRERSAPHRQTLERIRNGEIDDRSVDGRGAAQLYAPLAPKEREAEVLLSRLRLLDRPMIMIPFLGGPEIKAWDRRSFDGHVLELGTEPGMLARCRTLSTREIKQVLAFRRNLGWGSRVSYGDGRLRPKPGLTSLWVVDNKELNDALSDPVLHLHRFFDQFVLVEAGEREGTPEADAEHQSRWTALCSSLLSSRLAAGTGCRSLAAGSLKALCEARDDVPGWGDFLARLSLCSSLIRSPGGGDVQPVDVHVARDLARHVRESTARLSATTLNKQLDHTPAAESLEGFLRKLIKHGPCTRRTLARTYAGNDYQVVEALITRAKGMGLVVEDRKMLQLVGVATSQALAS